MTRWTLGSLALSLVFACRVTPTAERAPAEPSVTVAEPAPVHAEPAAPTDLGCPAVGVHGSMQRFNQGDLSQTVALSDLTWTDAAVALGATADKTAEITVVDGKVWIVAPSADGVDVVHDTKDQGGSLVATAAPTAWDAGRRVDSVDVASILSAVETARSGTGCAQAEAVPFVVRGHAESLTWSIVGQPSGKRGELQNVDVVLVGFWAPGARGIYVPASLDGHLHMVAPSANLAGHLNAIALRPGATLHLPATEG